MSFSAQIRILMKAKIMNLNFRVKNDKSKIQLKWTLKNEKFTDFEFQISKKRLRKKNENGP